MESELVMCGINGMVGEGISIYDVNKVTGSLHKMVHRGRDSCNVIKVKNAILGHNRLSIIDLDKRSDQPMRFKDLIISFNGEIYNFKEIRDELIVLGYKFKTESDTEVILKSFVEWGDNCTDHFVGQWAFVIYNKKDKILFMSRDRIGEKPLYYSIEKGRLCFASELPALLELTNEKYHIDHEALDLLFTGNIRHIPYDKSVLEGVHKLPAGHSLVFMKGKAVVWRYWKPTWKGKRSNPDEYKFVVGEAIRRTAVSDVPIGILLSGGVDSTTIAYFLKGRNPITYSVGQDKNDPELVRARKVAKKLGLRNKEIIISSDEVRMMTKSIKKKLLLIMILVVMLCLSRRKLR